MQLEVRTVETASRGRPPGAHLIDLTDPVNYLRHALSQKHFALYAQPMLSLRSPGRFPMAEIYVRMREEENALLPPGEFLAVFESFRMIPELDRWVVREALTLRHKRAGPQALSLNVGRQTIEDAKFPAFVAAELRQAGVGPERLLFEVAESDATASLRGVRSFSEALREIGCRLLIQDFGGRHASLDLLRIVAAAGVKIDRGVVSRLRTSALAHNLVGDLVRFAAARDLSVIAEAVEDRATLEILRSLGVGHAQGLGICAPAPL